MNGLSNLFRICYNDIMIQDEESAGTNFIGFYNNLKEHFYHQPVSKYLSH